MSKKTAKKVAEEIEKIEIPSALQQRSKLGIEQAKQELRKTTRSKRFLKKTAAVTAGILLAVGLGAATSPTFASFIKSLFLSSDIDEGLKNAVHQGYSEVVDMKVTDQGITLKVKEIVVDPYRVSVLFGLEKDGEELEADPLIYGGSPTGDPELDPFLLNMDAVKVLNEDGYELDRLLSNGGQSIGNDTMVYFLLDDIDDPSSPHKITNIPDNIVIDFDINQIGDISGQWHLQVPIDLKAAKSSVNTIPLNKRYNSPFGFSIDFLQLSHSPSKSELFYRFNVRRDQERLIHYEIKDDKDHVLASFDDLAYGLMSEGKELENKNYLSNISQSWGGLGYWEKRDAFLPFHNRNDMQLELKTVYTLEQTKDFSVMFPANKITEEPLMKEYEGKKFTFTTRMKTDEAEKRFPDGVEGFSGTGWIIEIDQLLDSETVGFHWEVADEHGNDILKAYEYGDGVEMKVIGSRDENGNYHSREWFFFKDKAKLPSQVTLHFNKYTKANAVNWSIPLEASSEPAPEAEPGFDVLVSELDPKIVKKAEQAINELIPSLPVEIVGAYHWPNDNGGEWLVYAEDESIARIDKETGEILNVNRCLPYKKGDKKLRQIAEQAIEELEPKLNDAFERVERYQSAEVNDWVLSGNRARVTIDPLTERVSEASVEYKPEQINAKAKEAAERAYAVMKDGKKLRLADGELVKTPTEHIWKLKSRAGSFRFHVGAKTNTLWSVSEQSLDDSPYDDGAFEQAYAKPYYSNEEAIAAAKPFVKKLFQIDLDEYEVKVHLNEYTFTKNGEPNIKAKINTQGAFWEYQLLPEQGIRD